MCCIKPEPSVPSKNKTEQDKTLAHAIAQQTFILAGGAKYLGRNTQEGVRLPDNPVFSQAGLRVDPNRPLYILQGAVGGKQNVWPCRASC